MNRLGKLAVVIVALVGGSTAHADFIERDFFDVVLGGVVNDPNNPSGGQILQGIGFFFRDDPIFAGVGDTIKLNFFFEARKRVQIFDTREVNDDFISAALGIENGEPSINSFLRTTFEMLGVRGSPGPNPSSSFVNSGGAGIGIGGTRNLTDSFVSFTGYSVTFDILSATAGFPATFTNWTGLQINAERIKVVPVPEPGTLALLTFGLLGMGLSRRRKQLT